MMTSEILQKFALIPLQSTEHPVAAQSGMVERMAIDRRMIIPRSLIYDVIFIVPLAEVASGLFYMLEASNIFVCQFRISASTIASMSVIIQ